MGNFTPKLDRRDIPYLITDEKIQTSNGIGEAFLLHDNVKKESIEIWTKESGKGVKITSYTIDTSELYKWRTKLTVFTKDPVVYVTYATFGDQVEAEDINGLQNAVTEIDKKINDHAQIPHGDMFINVYDNDLDGIVERADTADSVDWSGVRSKPATYMPSPHTHTEAEIVGLDKYTRQEVDTKLGGKADKSDVSSHTINGDIHVTIPDKVNWDSKAPGSHNHQIPDISGLQTTLDAKETPNGAQLKADKALAQAKTYAESKVAELVDSAPATLDTLYELSAALGNDPNFATTVAKSISEKETPVGAQSKVDAHAGRTDNPHAVTKSQIGLGNVSNVLQATKAEFDSHNDDGVRHISSVERATWNAKQSALGFIAENTANKGKASGYASLDTSGKVPIEQIPDNVVTQDELGAAGYGDMTVAVYDTNRDGVVDRASVADSVAWAGVTGKPSTFTPSTHTHTIAQVTSLQTTLDAKETPAGAQAKANVAEANAKAYAMKKGPVTWNDLSGT